MVKQLRGLIWFYPPVTEISHDQIDFNQDNALPLSVEIQQNPSVAWKKKIPQMFFDLPVHHRPFLLEDDNDASSYYPAYLSGSSDSSGLYITGSEFSESDLSDHDSNSCTSDGEIEKSDDPPTASGPNFTSKELTSMAIISFATRCLLSNEAASTKRTKFFRTSAIIIYRKCVAAAT